MNQCENICYSLDKSKVDECNAFCYAHHAPQNSNLNATDPAEHTCYKNIAANVYTDEWCSMGAWDEGESEAFKNLIVEDINEHKCRP